MTTARNGTLQPVAAYLAGLARPGPGDLTDGELLARFAGDRDQGETGAVESGADVAFTEIVRRHGGNVRAACVRGLGDAHADADDCVQAVFLILARRAREFADKPTVAGFLHGVAVRVAWKARAKRHRRHRAELAAARPEQTPPNAPDDTAAAVDRAVQSLPAALRDVVVLCDLAGVSRRDAAARLGIAEGTLSSRRATAHARLARRLGPDVGLPAVLAATLSADAVAAVVKVAVGPTGAVPAAVQALVRKAVLAMLFTKLKPVVAAGFLLAAACGTGVGVARVGGQPPAKPADGAKPTVERKPATLPNAGAAVKPFAMPVTYAEHLDYLPNLWKVTAIKEDGRDVEPKSAGYMSWMVFDDRGRCGISMKEERLGRPHMRVLQELPVFVSRTRTPREMTVVVTLTEGAEKTTDLWQMLYEPLGPDRMRIAYFRNWSWSDRPTGFACGDNPGAAGKLVVAELTAHYPKNIGWDQMKFQLSGRGNWTDNNLGHGFTWPEPGPQVHGPGK